MYYEYFGLRDAPFQFLPSNTLFLSAAHLEGLAALQWAFQEPSGLTLLVGEVGSGKTMLIHALVTRLKDDRIRVGQISNPTMSFEEMLDVIVQQLHIHPVGKGKRAALQALKTFVGDPASKDRVILIFDEAQGLSDETLEEVRLLSNTRPPQRHALQIILVGQPELAQRLSDPKLRALNQRIGARAVLRPLRGQEVGDYVNCLLRAQGATRELFARDAMDQVARLSGGLPRKINNLCHNSLFQAYAQRSDMVEPAHVQAASAELENLLEAAERSEPGILGWRGAMNWIADKGKPLVAGGILVLAIVAGAMVLESGAGHPNAPLTNPTLKNDLAHTEVARETEVGSSKNAAAVPEMDPEAPGKPTGTDASSPAGSVPSRRAEPLAKASAAPAAKSVGKTAGMTVAMAPHPAAHAPEPVAQPSRAVAPLSSAAARPVPAPAAQAARSEKAVGSTIVSGPIPQLEKAKPENFAAARPPQPAGEPAAFRLSHAQQRRLQYESRRAKTSFGQGRYLNAIYHLKRALILDPDNADMRDMLQRAEEAQGIPRRSAFTREEAASSTDDADNSTADAAPEVPRRSSYSGVIRYEISEGDAYMRAGKYDLALRKFLTAAVLDPDDADLNQRIARARGAKAVLENPNNDSATTADPRSGP